MLSGSGTVCACLRMNWPVTSAKTKRAGGSYAVREKGQEIFSQGEVIHSQASDRYSLCQSAGETKEEMRTVHPPIDLDQQCKSCGCAVQVIWSPLWREYLCAECRWNRADSESENIGEFKGLESSKSCRECGTNKSVIWTDTWQAYMCTACRFKGAQEITACAECGRNVQVFLVPESGKFVCIACQGTGIAS